MLGQRLSLSCDVTESRPSDIDNRQCSVTRISIQIKLMHPWIPCVEGMARLSVLVPLSFFIVAEFRRPVGIWSVMPGSDYDGWGALGEMLFGRGRGGGLHGQDLQK